MFKVSCIQLCSSDNVENNLKKNTKTNNQGNKTKSRFYINTRSFIQNNIKQKKTP